MPPAPRVQSGGHPSGKLSSRKLTGTSPGRATSWQQPRSGGLRQNPKRSAAVPLPLNNGMLRIFGDEVYRGGQLWVC